MCFLGLLGLGLNAIICCGLSLKKIFPLVALSMVASMLGAGIISPLLPIYAETMGIGGLWLGVIFVSFVVSRAIVMPIVGKLSDRNGRKIFISLGLLAFALTSLGYVWAAGPGELTLVRLLQGASAALIAPIAQAYVGDLSPRGEEGKWMGYFNAAFFVGFGLGPLIGGVFAEHVEMNLGFYVMAGINFVVFIVVLLFLPEQRAKDRADLAPSTSYRKMFGSGMIRGLASYRLTYALARGAFATFLPVFAAIYAGLGTASTGIILAVAFLVMGLSEIYSGGLADRFNRRALVVIGSVIELVFLALIPLMHSFWPLMVISIASAIGGAFSMPAASALTVEEGRRFGMGSAIGLFVLAMSVGMILGPMLGGLLEETVGVSSVFPMAAGMIVLGIILFLQFTRQSQSRKPSLEGYPFAGNDSPD